MKQVRKNMAITMLVALIGTSSVLADVTVKLRSGENFEVVDRSDNTNLLSVFSNGDGKAVLGSGNGPAIVDNNQIATKKYVDDQVAGNKAFASYLYAKHWGTFTQGKAIAFSETDSIGSDLTISTHADGHHVFTVNTAGDYYVSMKANKDRSSINECQNEFQINGSTDYSVYARTANTAWSGGYDSAIFTFKAGDVLRVINSSLENKAACSDYPSLPGMRLLIRKI